MSSISNNPSEFVWDFVQEENWSKELNLHETSDEQEADSSDVARKTEVTAAAHLSTEVKSEDQHEEKSKNDRPFVNFYVKSDSELLSGKVGGIFVPTINNSRQEKRRDNSSCSINVSSFFGKMGSWYK